MELGHNLKEDGSKTTGWVNDSGTWYYLDDKGIMQTGWLKEKGHMVLFK